MILTSRVGKKITVYVYTGLSLQAVISIKIGILLNLQQIKWDEICKPLENNTNSYEYIFYQQKKKKNNLQCGIFIKYT